MSRLSRPSPFEAAKVAKKLEYEAACRTPGTPEHAARQRRLAERTRELERDEINRKRTLRREIAAASLETQRKVIDQILRAQKNAKV